jgi:YHS domain-containing protein
MVRDPVFGMVIEPQDAAATREHMGQTLYFCSPNCVEQLDADPQQVVAKAWERLRPGGHVVLIFETAGDSWGNPVVGYLWRWFSARLVPEAEARRFPRFQSITMFQACVSARGANYSAQASSYV